MITTTLDLFPTDFSNKQCNISNIIIIKIFSIWINAINCFLNKNYINLDALVCENACQIRAMVLFDIYTKLQIPQNIFEILTFRDRLLRLIDEMYNISFNDKDFKNSIYNTLKKHDIYFEIRESIFWDLKFIIHCYILTLTKKQIPSNLFVLNEKTCNKKILDMGLVLNKTKTFILSTQKELSAMSCQYIQQLALNQNDDFRFLLDNVQKDSHGRSYLPQHPISRIFINNTLQNNKSIIIKVVRYFQQNIIDEIYLYAEPDKTINDFKIQKNIPKNKPCIILSGIVNYVSLIETKNQYIKRIGAHPISLLINANLAAHPQFSGSLSNMDYPYKNLQNNSMNNKLIDKAYKEYLEHKSFANKNGCSLNNPTLIFLNHIYFDISDNYISLVNTLKNTKKYITLQESV